MFNQYEIENFILNTDIIQHISTMNNTNPNLSSYAVQNQNLSAVRMSSFSNIISHDLYALSDSSDLKSKSDNSIAGTPSYFTKKMLQLKKTFNNDNNQCTNLDKEKLIEFNKGNLNTLIKQNKRNIDSFIQFNKLIKSEDFEANIKKYPDIAKFVTSDYFSKLMGSENKYLEVINKYSNIKREFLNNTMSDNTKFKIDEPFEEQNLLLDDADMDEDDEEEFFDDDIEGADDGIYSDDENEST